MNTIQILEFLKYFSLKGQLIGFDNSGGDFLDYVTKETEFITTPENLKFKIRQFRINWGEVKSNQKSVNFCERNFCFDLRNNSDILGTENNPENLIRPINAKPFSSGGKQYIRYLFYSNHYYNEMKRDPNWHMQTVNQYDNVLWLNEMGESYYPFSMIISIPNESKVDFEKFLNLKMGEIQYHNGVREVENNTWRKYFYTALDKAIRNNAEDLQEILKYPSEVIIDELCLNSNNETYSLNDLKLLIKKIADYWNGIFSSISDDDKKNLIFGILEKIQKKDAGEIYDLFFQSDTLYFKKYKDLLGDDEAIKFVYLLMRLFYMKIDFNEYKTQISNLPSDHIIPIIKEDFLPHNTGASNVLLTKGPEPSYEMTDYGLKIEKIDFYTFKFGDSYSKIVTGEKDPCRLIKNKFYNYNEIIGLFCCFSRKEVGLMQGMIYPVPAFAYEAFHKGLSKDYTILTFINDLSNAAGVLFPFFNILIGEEVVINLILLIIGETGLLLDSDIMKGTVDDLKKTPKGKVFLYTYYFISGFWGNCEQINVVSKAINTNKYKAIFDFENLLSAWGAFYADPNDFMSVADNPNREELIKLMNRIQKDYERYKK
ncbi:hypothetical protein C3729_13005 [Cloacibacterium normanense]|uniref:Uncharacterized protein n=1 Tax=Cloacibacterium normanense TaxID=237258 RepID=A0A2S7I1S2_9FLAO|nr:hypothetical protein [Cloacibacterium normanense]PPZ90530.1 hypothetical protein C3729_13005 [Cloacibacterium normanense]